MTHVTYVLCLFCVLGVSVIPIMTSGYNVGNLRGRNIEDSKIGSAARHRHKKTEHSSVLRVLSPNSGEPERKPALLCGAMSKLAASAGYGVAAASDNSQSRADMLLRVQNFNSGESELKPAVQCSCYPQTPKPQALA